MGSAMCTNGVPEPGDCSFLVAVCRGTRKKFCEYTKDKTAKETLQKLWKLFNTFGFPQEIRRDRAPTFSQSQFA